MNCPKCGAAVNPRLVASGLGRCLGCDHVWEVDAGASSPEAGVSGGSGAGVAHAEPPRVGGDPQIPGAADLDPMPGPPPTRPAGVQVYTTEDGVLVRIPWRIQATLIVHLFFCAIGLVFIAPFLGYSTMRGWEVPFAGAMLVLYVYLLVNTTEVRIRPDGVQVRHGPLPSIRDRAVDLPANRIRTLDVRAETMYHRGRPVTHWSLWSGPTLVLRKFAEEATVAYVAHRIAEGVDAPVVVRIQPDG